MKRSLIIISCVISIALLGMGIWKFSDAYAYSSKHFPSKTVINGCDCSGLTVEQANALITKTWNGRSVRIADGSGAVIGEVGASGLTYDIKGELGKKLHQSIINSSVSGAVRNSGKNDIAMKISSVGKSFTDSLAGLEFLNAHYSTKTRNAYVDMSNTDFKIIKEVYGNNISKKRFEAAILNSISHGKWTMSYDPSKYYELPSVKEGDQSLKDRQEYCKKYLTQKITYDMRGTKVLITPKQLSTIVKADASGKITYDPQGAYNVVDEIADKYDTAYSYKRFTTAGGNVIYVQSMGYGYIMDRKAESEALISLVKSGKDSTRTPVYSRKPFFGGDEFNGNFVEVDISAQHLYMVKNGAVIVSTPIVTGNAIKGHGTPRGIYALQYKTRNATLRGNNDDGTKYESKVSYWMPFNGGVGLHDAPWRSVFGGAIYRDGGSHGCVNMPISAAATVFESIQTGWPVVVHD